MKWLLLPVAMLVLWLALINFVFVVRSVEVVGAGSVDPEAVARVSGIQLGSKLGSLDVKAIRDRIDSTGMLAFVDLTRRCPTTAVLTVRERSRDAMILHSGKVLMLDSDGCVVAVIDSVPDQATPYVTGLKPTTYHLGHQLECPPARLQAMKAVIEALKEKSATAYVSELNVEDPTDIRILTRTGMTVLLGDQENMTRKIVWMAGTLQDLESRGQTLGRLDVSSGTKADYLPMVVATPTPAATQNTYLLDTPTPAPTEVPSDDGAVIGEDAI